MDKLKNNLKELFRGWNTIPNWLSFIRIALIPVFMVLFLNGHMLIAVIIMICAALTDLFDGKIRFQIWESFLIRLRISFLRWRSLLCLLLRIGITQ